MKNPFRRSTPRLGRWALRTLCLMTVAWVLTFTATRGEADAEQYDPKKAANPIRVSAYILHPVGVLLDYGLVRPCFWIVQHEPFSTIFGYERPSKEHPPEQD